MFSTTINGIMRRTGVSGGPMHIISRWGRTEGIPNNLSFGLALTAYQFAINTDGLIYDKDDPLMNSYGPVSILFQISILVQVFTDCKNIMLDLQSPIY